MSDKEQAVAGETEDQSRETGVEESGAREQQDDLDKALAEYGASEEKPEPKQQDSGSQQPDDVAEFVRSMQAERVQQDISRAVETAKGDLEVDDRVVKAILNDQAQEDQRFLRAWNDRHANPKGWERALKAMTPEIEKMVGPKVDKDATEDREAVAAAVRGSSNKAPEPDDEVPDFRGKSDAEFYGWLQNQKA